MQSVPVPELVQTLCTIMEQAGSETIPCIQTGACESWISECGEVIIERRETAQDELRFFLQDPDDYYTEFRLSFRSYLVFAYRDWVWSNFSRCSESNQDIPEACWQILSERSHAIDPGQCQAPESRTADANQRNSRHSLANLLRAS